jgi:hypothetical protein
VGFDAAVLFGWLRFRCELHTGGYEADHETLATETRLTLHRVRKATKRLREAGWIESRRASSWNPTPFWSVRWEAASRDEEIPHYVACHSRTTSTKKFKEEKNSPAAAAAECLPSPSFVHRYWLPAATDHERPTFMVTPNEWDAAGWEYPVDIVSTLLDLDADGVGQAIVTAERTTGLDWDALDHGEYDDLDSDTARLHAHTLLAYLEPAA